MTVWFIALVMTCCSLRCGAQDSRCWDCPYVAPDTIENIVVIEHAQTDTVEWTPMWVITNLEYVTIRNLTGKHKLRHVKYLILRNGCYYFPNISPVEVYNYKVFGLPEVIVKYKP